jgi:very-short-patch-repair endonuclease
MWAQIDTLIARLAERQHGVVEHNQLLGLGLSQSGIDRRLASGRLHRLHRGVYAVGHRKVTAPGRRMAAVLACGPGAVISHETAADMLNIRPTASPAIHVTVPTTAGRRRPGIKIHRTSTLRAEDVTTVDGIPVTSVSRTLTDLARTLDAASLRKTIERADRLNVLDLNTLPRTGRLQQALADAHFGDLRSDLESDFLAVCRAHGIQTPETNVLLLGHTVDFLWREERLVVETDGWEYHHDRAAVRRDHRRDAALAREGFLVLHYTHHEVNHDPATPATEVAGFLAQRKPRLRNQ